MMEQMRQRQQQAQQQGQGASQAGQGGQDRRPMGPPQRSPEEEAKRLKTSLDAIAKSAVFLQNAKYVK
jgi:hypothetical protein